MYSLPSPPSYLLPINSQVVIYFWLKTQTSFDRKNVCTLVVQILVSVTKILIASKNDVTSSINKMKDEPDRREVAMTIEMPVFVLQEVNIKKKTRTSKRKLKKQFNERESFDSRFLLPLVFP